MMKPAYLFIRDDDVKRMDKTFSWFFQGALSYKIPVVYAVIPGQMDKDVVKAFRKQKKETPDLLDIVQHGWKHTDHARSGERKYEFGPSRTDVQQSRDLRRGCSAMREAFGSAFLPVFVPPYHGFDPVTLGVVERMRFQGFSAGKKALSARSGVLDIPAVISFGAKHKETGHQKMLLEVAKRAVSGRLTGILLHHAELSAAGMEDEIILFFRGLARWRDKGLVRIILLSDILDRKGCCPEAER